MKKRLLNEQTTRKMMGLAGIGSLSEKFIKEADEVEEGMYAKRNDEEVEEGMHPKRDEMLEQEPGEKREEDPMDVPVDAPVDAPVGDPGMEAGDLEGEVAEPAGEKPAGEGMLSVEDFLAAFEMALEKVLPGEDVDVDMADEPGLEPEPEPEMAMAEGDYVDEDDVMEDLNAAGVELEEDNNLEEDDASLEEDIVNEITRRVARRLLRESAKTKK